MDNRPTQNVQEVFLNYVRKEKRTVLVYLVSGVKLSGKLRSFDKFAIVLESGGQEQLIYKQAISTVVRDQSATRSEDRSPSVETADGQVSLPSVQSQDQAS